MTVSVIIAQLTAALSDPIDNSTPGNKSVKVTTEIPSYLKGYKSLYEQNPLSAAIQWHKDAKFGLFIHYALASLRPVTAEEAIKLQAISSQAWNKVKSGSIEEYQKYFKNFKAEKFDADFITDLAIEAGMRYINFTTRHLGNMYMYNTKLSEFSSVNSPAGRDFIAELAENCRKKGLGLFLYCPPDVARTEPQEQLEKNYAIIRELLTNYGPIAGIWFDGIGPYYKDPSFYKRINKLYDLVHSIQPQCLVSFKQGTGTEDFVAPERSMRPGKEAIAKEAWEKNSGKRGDICSNMQQTPDTWIYINGSKHLTSSQLWDKLADALTHNANLTINIGPLPDGSIHPDDIISFREIGARIRKEGYPDPVKLK